jgi:hypothetical protein
MGDNYIQLPPNSTGEKVRTNTRTVGADTVNEHYMIPIDVTTGAIPDFATSTKQLANGHEVEVNNLPADYPLPAAQIITLTPPAAISGFATVAMRLGN